MKFRAIVQLNGKTATGIRVPAEVVASLGSSKRPAVRVSINGHTYRSTVASMGGEFMLPVSAENRASARIAAGDEIEVDVEPDTAPREVEVPSDLRELLDKDADAKKIFDGLSYSKKQQIVYPIEEAKTAETRQRRIEKAISQLREGKI